MTLDIAISRGHFPVDSDLPRLVRELSLKDEVQSSQNPAPKDSPPGEQPVAQDGDNDNNQAKGEASSTAPFVPQIDSEPPGHIWQIVNKDITDDESSDNVTSSVSPEANQNADIPLFTQTMNEWSATSPSMLQNAAAAAAAAGGMHRDAGRMGLPPQFHEVNLDFFDLGNNQGGMGMGNHPGAPDESETVESTWANTMIDEILNAISA